MLYFACNHVLSSTCDRDAIRFAGLSKCIATEKQIRKNLYFSAQGHSRSLLSVSIETRVWLPILVINCNLGTISHRFRDTATFRFKSLPRGRHSRSRSSKVIDLGLNGKPIGDFLLLINCNLGPISHRFQNTASYWFKIAKFSYHPLI